MYSVNSESLRHIPLFQYCFIILVASVHLACVACPQFYGGPDLQRAGFWRARGRSSYSAIDGRANKLLINMK